MIRVVFSTVDSGRFLPGNAVTQGVGSTRLVPLPAHWPSMHVHAASSRRLSPLLPPDGFQSAPLQAAIPIPFTDSLCVFLLFMSLQAAIPILEFLVAVNGSFLTQLLAASLLKDRICAFACTFGSIVWTFPGMLDVVHSASTCVAQRVCRSDIPRSPSLPPHRRWAPFTSFSLPPAPAHTLAALKM